MGVSASRGSGPCRYPNVPSVPAPGRRRAMTDGTGLDPATRELQELLHDFGQRWKICQREYEWEADPQEHDRGDARCPGDPGRATLIERPRWRARALEQAQCAAGDPVRP